MCINWSGWVKLWEGGWSLAGSLPEAVGKLSVARGGGTIKASFAGK